MDPKAKNLKSAVAQRDSGSPGSRHGARGATQSD
jgi:hypothetical protein